MAVFIELTSTPMDNDRFMARAGGRAGTSSARRPTNGIEIKEDTYAMIRVIKADGEEVQLVNSSVADGRGDGTTNFLLQSVSDVRVEKQQLLETFGDAYLYLFGEAPRFIDVNAVLLDTNDFNWAAEFQENYNEYLRGTKCAEVGAKAYLFYDDTIVEGYMLQAQTQKSAQQPHEIQLGFRLFVSRVRNVSIVGDTIGSGREGVNRQGTYTAPPGFMDNPNQYVPIINNVVEYTIMMSAEYNTTMNQTKQAEVEQDRASHVTDQSNQMGANVDSHQQQSNLGVGADATQAPHGMTSAQTTTPDMVGTRI